MGTHFIGRESELSRIQREITRPQLSTILVYGRRRVGKSELLKQAILSEDCPAIYFECRQTSEQDNLASLSQLVTEALHLPPFAFRSLRELLELVFTQSTQAPLTLVLDEYPYLRQAVTGLDSILQSLIDTHRSHCQLTLILCGSYVEVMRSLIKASNPLYGRIDLTLDLKPMDYLDSARFYPSFSPADKVRLFSVFGGIPYYNQLIDPTLTVRENIIELLTAPGARLESEVPAYVAGEISKITNANEVFGALARGYSRWRDLLDQSHVSSGPAMSDVLAKLMSIGLVSRRFPINDPANRRKSGYYISDPLALFHYRFLFRFASQRQLLAPETFFERFVAAELEEQHVPHLFEEVCRQYLVRRNRAGLIEPPFDAIGTYWYDDPVHHTSGEFDVVTHDPQGYAFYEAKFRGMPVSARLIEEEVAQVRATRLECHTFGFFSRSGFADGVQASWQDPATLRLITLEEMYA